MRKKLIEKIKPEVLQAVRAHTFNSDDFKQKEYHWFVHNENMNDLYDKPAFYRIYELLARGITSHISQTAKDYFIMNNIAHFSSNLSIFEKLKFLKHTKNGQVLKRYKRTKNGFILTDAEGRDVKINLISNFKHAKKIFPDLIDFYKRTGDCHRQSMNLSMLWNNDDVYVVTGNVTSVRDNHQFVHTWIELVASETGKVMVVDYNYNAIFDRDDYYRLQHAEPLSYVPQEKIRDFLKKGYCEKGGYLHGIDLKFLLLYFDDVMEIVNSLPEEEINKYKKEAEPAQMGE